MKRGKKHKKGKCCCKSNNILECLSTIDKQIDHVKSCVPHKHLSRSTREKVLFCLVLRDIACLERKLDRILCELTSDCWDSDCCSVCDSHSDCDSDCDSDSDSHCDSDCDSDSKCHHRAKK